MNELDLKHINRHKPCEACEKMYMDWIKRLEKQNELLIEQLRLKHLTDPISMIVPKNVELIGLSPTPPVNESWEKEFQKEMMLLCWEIEKLPPSEQQTKTVLLAGKIKDNLKKFFGEQSSLLSTARQEERERFSGWIAEAYAESDDIVQMQKFLRNKLNTVDSLTSKGGTNEG